MTDMNLTVSLSIAAIIIVAVLLIAYFALSKRVKSEYELNYQKQRKHASKKKAASDSPKDVKELMPKKPKRKRRSNRSQRTIRRKSAGYKGKH